MKTQATVLAALVLTLAKAAAAEPGGLESPAPDDPFEPRMATTVTVPQKAATSTTHADVRLVVSGAATFLVSYGVSLGVAAANASTFSATQQWTTNALFAPVVGPFIVMGAAAGSKSLTTQCDPFCGILPAAEMVLALDGVAQAGGLALFIAGLVSRVPRTVGPLKDVAPIPLAGRSTTGLALRASF